MDSDKRAFFKAVLSLFFVVILSGCGDQAASQSVAPEWEASCDNRSLGTGDRREAPSATFVFAGQSNMTGYGDGSAVPIQTAVVWVDDHWETYAPRDCFGPDLAFIQNWASNNTGTIGVIKYAVPGTSMGDWAVSWDPAVARQPELGSLYANLVAMTRAAAVPVVAIVWAQGESDALTSGTAAVYEGRLQEFITALRSEVGWVPFVLAQTSSPAEYLGTIQAAQTALTTWGLVGMAPTTDFLTWDGVHYNTEGQLTLGARLYAAWQSLES